MTTINKTPKQKIELIEGQFSVNPSYSAERTGDYELRDKIAAKWGNFDKRLEGCGNCNHEFYFDTAKQTFLFSSDWLHSDERYLSIYRIISPSLLLYRLIATFFGNPVCQDGYKSIWEYNLVHKATGKGLSFSEWKGAAGFWVPEGNSKQLNAEFKKDLIELMNYLISQKCAHPYDNLVAGSVA